MQRRMNGRSAPPASAALTKELHEIIESDRYPFSPRIRTLRAILVKLRPEPVRGVQTHPSRKCANKFGAKTKIGQQLSARSRQTFILSNCSAPACRTTFPLHTI